VVEVTTPPHNPARRFINAIAVIVPVLAATAAAYAGIGEPPVMLTVNETQQVRTQTLSQMASKAADPSRQTPATRSLAGKVAECMISAMDAPVSATLVASVANLTASVSQKIMDWANKTGRNPAEAVALACDPAEDILDLIDSHDATVARLNQMSAGAGDAYHQSRLALAYRDMGARTQAVQNAVYEIAEVPGYGDVPTIKVGGELSSWLNAATSIAQGAASLTGNKDVERSVREATGSVRRGGGYVNRADSIGRRGDVTDKVRGVGELMGSVGREVNRHTNNSRHSNSGTPRTTPRFNGFF